MFRPPSLNRRKPRLPSKTVTEGVRFAEVAGGTTAECAAVCCCCPCIVINFLVLAIYKVPASLYRRALRTKRRQRMKKKKKKGALPARRGRSSPGEYDETDIQILSAGRNLYSSEPKVENSEETERKVMELDKEMWESFYNNGFWRSHSHSQRDQISNHNSVSTFSKSIH